MTNRGQRGRGRGHIRAGKGSAGRGDFRGKDSRNHDQRFQSLPDANGELNAHIQERVGHRFQPAGRHQDKRTHEAELNGLKIELNPRIREYIQKQEASREAEPAEDWLTAPEVASSSEIALADGSNVVLPPNRIEKPYKSTAKYLKTQYKLLREDAVGPLRDAIDLFKRDPEILDNADSNKILRTYEKVYISGFTFTHNGIAARIKFSTRRAGKRIFWAASKRLISGTIVALSPVQDQFRRQCIVAVVAARPLDLIERHPPEVDVYFSRPEDVELDSQQEFVMIEASMGYYEAHRHTLKALQKMSTEPFPLSDLILAQSSELGVPPYLSSWSNRDLSAASIEGAASGMGSVDVLRDWPESCDSNTLDASQWDALHHILTKNFAIIQGPPGTGKTHVSKIALQIMIENRSDGDPPIIVAAQTNHALDQLLDHVSAFDANYIRLGGRSTKPEVKKRALYEVRRSERIPNIPGSQLGSAHNALNAIHTKFGEILALVCDSNEPISSDTLFRLGIITDKQRSSLEAQTKNWVTADSAEVSPVQHWLHKALIPFEVVYDADYFGFEEIEEGDLELEQVREVDAEHGVNDEEDIEQLRGPWKAIFDRWTVPEPNGHDLERAKQLLDTRQDLWSIPEHLRGPVYLVMQQRAKFLARARFREVASEYDHIVQELKIGKWEKDSVYLKRANIIGMTTTGLSKYRPLIASLEPKIILIEEAAEVIEAPIAAACMASLEHLILVGDHQQLQGHCGVPELEGAPYHLQVSMFERLVKMNLSFKMLLRQRRMRPEFRQLISPLYPALEDHSHVTEREEPTAYGMGKIHSFFFHHEWLEQKDSSLSTFNPEEARLVVKFYRHLLRNGIPPAGVTILTFYNGQRKQILRELRDDSETNASYNIVKTVDSYQGEENKFVILSLVRSNSEEKIGFLNIDNRVCVALSRAQFGFYIFGNAEMLARQSDLWNQVKTTLEWAVPKRIGHRLPITCTMHGRTLHMKFPEDFDSTNGGCDQMCRALLECGHVCPQRCHPYPHSTIRCQLLCERHLVCGHRCRRNCHEPCLCDCAEFQQAVAQVAMAKHPDDPYFNRAGFSPEKPRPAVATWNSLGSPRSKDALFLGHSRQESHGSPSGRKLARGGGAFQPQGLGLDMSSPIHPGNDTSDSRYMAGLSAGQNQETPPVHSQIVKNNPKPKHQQESTLPTTSSRHRDQGVQVDLLDLSPPQSQLGRSPDSPSRRAQNGRNRYVQTYETAATSESRPYQNDAVDLLTTDIIETSSGLDAAMKRMGMNGRTGHW